MHLNLHSERERERKPLKIIAKSTRCNRALNIYAETEKNAAKNDSAKNKGKKLREKEIRIRQMSAELEKCKSTEKQKKTEREKCTNIV